MIGVWWSGMHSYSESTSFARFVASSRHLRIHAGSSSPLLSAAGSSVVAGVSVVSGSNTL